MFYFLYKNFDFCALYDNIHLIKEKKMETKFYVCPVCGQIITKLKDQNIPVICCGQVMKQLVAGEVEASTEKHIPVCEKNGNVVNVVVGSVEHPMSPEHYIEWVCLKSKQTTQIKHLAPTDKPQAVFALANDDEVEEVFAYCNLHGLWKC